MKKVLLRAAAAAGMSAALGLAAPARALTFSDVYSNNFQSGDLTGWGISSVTQTVNGVTLPARTLGTSATPMGGRIFLGEFGGDDQVSLTLTGLAPGLKTVRLSFDAYLIRSWDGNDSALASDAYLNRMVPLGPDVFGWTRTGAATPPFEYTFSQGSVGQSFCPFVGNPCQQTQAAKEKNTLGYHYTVSPDGTPVAPTDANKMDMVYSFAGQLGPANDTPSFLFDYSGTSLTLTFYSRNLQLRGQPGELLLDESWGLDNVRVEVAAIPEPGTYALIAAGLVAVLLMSRRRLQARA